jgi:hypothetical protein
MPVPGPAPFARLRDTARKLGIIVVDAVDADGPLLDDGTAAFVACGVCIALRPGLDDGMRADVLAMALALTYAMSPGKIDHAGDITAASGFVLISGTREAGPGSALGLLATVIAREHGRDTASAAFGYAMTVLKLAWRAAESARWPRLAGFRRTTQGLHVPQLPDPERVVTGSLRAVCLGIIGAPLPNRLLHHATAHATIQFTYGLTSGQEKRCVASLQASPYSWPSAG